MNINFFSFFYVNSLRKFQINIHFVKYEDITEHYWGCSLESMNRHTHTHTRTQSTHMQTKYWGVRKMNTIFFIRESIICIVCILFIYILFLIPIQEYVYWFLEIEEVRERQTDIDVRETSSGCLLFVLWMGTKPAAQVCAQTGDQTHNLGDAPAKWATWQGHILFASPCTMAPGAVTHLALI